MLATERLIIRPFLETDYNDLYEYLSLEEIYQFEPGEPISLEAAKKIVEERAKGTNFWAATLTARNNKLIGHVSLFQSEPEHVHTWEIGYIFNPVYQHKGYATEATRTVIAYAFNELKAHRIVGFCSTENIPSWKVLEKCGMKKEGLLKKNIYFRTDKDGKPVWYNSFAYAILEEDFLRVYDR